MSVRKTIKASCVRQGGRKGDASHRSWDRENRGKHTFRRVAGKGAAREGGTRGMRNRERGRGRAARSSILGKRRQSLGKEPEWGIRGTSVAVASCARPKGKSDCHSTTVTMPRRGEPQGETLQDMAAHPPPPLTLEHVACPMWHTHVKLESRSIHSPERRAPAQISKTPGNGTTYYSVADAAAAASDSTVFVR